MEMHIKCQFQHATAKLTMADSRPSTWEFQRQILLMHCWSPEPTRKSKRIFREKVCIEIVVLVGGIISKLKLESKVTRVREYSADRACIRIFKTDLIVYCGKYITDIPGYFNYVNIVIFRQYKTLLCTYSAVETRTDQQTMQPWAIATLPAMQTLFSKYMFSICSASIFSVYVQQGKQWWNHVKILTPKQYEYIIQLTMKVCITFYAFLNPGEKKYDFWFLLWNSIFLSHFQTNLLIIL